MHSAVPRGNDDTTVVLHMLSDAGARVLMVPPDSSLIYGSTGSASWSALNLQRSVGSPGGGIDLFCGGHATLADGSLLFASGTEKGVNGHRLCRVFDPTKLRNASNGWSDTDSLNYARWYPTLTTLGDGRVMAYSGLQYFELLTFGGALASGQATSDAHPMVLERSPYWNQGSVPIPDLTLGSSPPARTDAAVTGFQMRPREEPNLVLLPTGDVVAMGGRLAHDDVSLPQPRPQIFNGAVGGWSDPMDPDPSTRGYHSTAVLLPDARVLSLGGNTGNTDSLYHGTVFEPPYLFDGSSYASRPSISLYDPLVPWGQVDSVYTDRAATIVSAALVRPGATTHAFDQNQRYVLLSFTRDATGGRLAVTMPVDGNTAPPGDYMLFLVDSLTPGLRRVPSLARWVRVRSGTDVIRPDSLTMTANYEVACTQAWFEFLATADDSSKASSGRAANYDFRFIASSATTPPAPAEREAWFDNMTPVTDEPAPMTVGSTQSHLFTGLQPLTWYWLALRASDPAGNKSPLTLIRVRTLSTTACSDEEFVCVHCNGSGGGYRMRPDGALSSLGESPLTESPSVLDGATPEQDAEDLVPYSGAGIGDSTVNVTLRSSGSRTIALDRVRLVAVEHGAADQVFWGGGVVFAGTPAAGLGAWVDDTLSVPGLAAGTLTGPLTLTSGQTVRVSLPAGPSGARTLLVDVARAGTGILPPDAGIEVFERSETGGWQSRGQVYPRTTRCTLPLGGLSGTEVRLEAHTDVELWGVFDLVPSTMAALSHDVRASSAVSARRGDIRSLVLSDDDLRADFTGPDTLMLAFTLPAALPGHVQSLFVGVQARLGAITSPMGAAAQRPVTETPLAFALHQSRPNPTRSGALIPFDLPAPAVARLEVFDAQGRRVHRAVGRFTAGHHEWSLVAPTLRLAPGVYTYRLTAGPNRAQRKLVVLP